MWGAIGQVEGLAERGSFDIPVPPFLGLGARRCQNNLVEVWGDCYVSSEEAGFRQPSAWSRGLRGPWSQARQEHPRIKFMVDHASSANFPMQVASDTSALPGGAPPCWPRP